MLCTVSMSQLKKPVLKHLRYYSISFLNSSTHSLKNHLTFLGYLFLEDMLTINSEDILTIIGGNTMNLKQMVGIEAAKYVKDEMTVGLGTGSTAYFMVEEIGRRVKEENLNIVGVTTSKATEKQALSLGIPLKSIDEVDFVDLTIDGADEISEDYQGTKGGGAALLFEKIVATYSKEVIWIVDESKMVKHLGAFPLPVEVIPYGSDQLLRKFTAKELNPKIRLTEDGNPLLTDSKNYIIDLYLEDISAPQKLAVWLDHQVGVVEHGLFLDMVTRVIIGTSTEGVKTINVPR